MARDAHDLAQRPAHVLRDALASGALDAEDLADACLTVIDQRESEIGAWHYLDQAHVRAQAQALDRWRKSGKPIGPLHGLPVGIKDIIDVHGMPTENGTPLCAGQRPRRDAWLVARLKAAGALIMGKTVTTELAVLHPAGTRNPHDPARTPGGSSSGSAAAVAAGMVPLAIGSQTNGSVIRPASFCGVVGYKPSFGLVPRTGVLTQSPSLDHIGVFARALQDVALIGDVIIGDDAGDPVTRPRPSLQLDMTAASAPPLPPRFGLWPSSAADLAEAPVRLGLEELNQALGAQCTLITLPERFAQIWSWHRAIMLADLAVSFAPLEARDATQLSRTLRAMLEDGRSTSATAYIEAERARPPVLAMLDEVFAACDALIVPAVRGEAPLGLGSTGDPVFCTPWTYLGLPALTLPLLQGDNGMPIGVQLVGRFEDDGRLLRTANWLVRALRGEGRSDA